MNSWCHQDLPTKQNLNRICLNGCELFLVLYEYFRCSTHSVRRYVSTLTSALLDPVQLLLLFLVQYTVLGDIHPGHRNWLEVLGAAFIVIAGGCTHTHTHTHKHTHTHTHTYTLTNGRGAQSHFCHRELFLEHRDGNTFSLATLVWAPILSHGVSIRTLPRQETFSPEKLQFQLKKRFLCCITRHTSLCCRHHPGDRRCSRDAAAQVRPRLQQRLRLRGRGSLPQGRGVLSCGQAARRWQTRVTGSCFYPGSHWRRCVRCCVDAAPIGAQRTAHPVGTRLHPETLLGVDSCVQLGDVVGKTCSETTCPRNLFVTVRLGTKFQKVPSHSKFQKVPSHSSHVLPNTGRVLPFAGVVTGFEGRSIPCLPCVQIPGGF